MKKLARVLLALVLLVVVAGVGTYLWAGARVSSVMSRTMETHRVDFAIPFPLTAAERARLAPGENAEAAALANALERGRHLVESRYPCVACHGESFGGGVMIDDPMIGRLLGPNLTEGAGSRTLTYEATDWDRAVRHGVKPGGLPSTMPSEDFQLMSDQELSDIIVFIRSLPPVDAEVPNVRLGPLGRVLLALGELPVSVDLIPSHDSPHPATPPAATVSTDFGRHLAGICVGCHQANLAGGPIPGGDPSWPPARNLTPHVDGLAGWTFSDFRRVLLDARRPDGTAIRPPMSDIMPFAANMTDVEMEALWSYLQSVQPAPTPR